VQAIERADVVVVARTGSMYSSVGGALESQPGDEGHWRPQASAARQRERQRRWAATDRDSRAPLSPPVYPAPAA